MKNAFSTTYLAFENGCMIFMLSLCYQYWQIGEAAFENVVSQFDKIVLGIFIVGIVGGGVGTYIYKLKIQYKFQIALHYGTTILSIMILSIWLGFVNWSFLNLIFYFTLTSIIFIILWVFNYFMLVNDAKKINAILESRK